MAVFLVIAFAGGITVLRQTKAIWHMNSPNAVSFNNTLNTFTSIEPIFIIIVIFFLIVALMTTSRAF